MKVGPSRACTDTIISKWDMGTFWAQGSPAIIIASLLDGKLNERRLTGTVYCSACFLEKRCWDRGSTRKDARLTSSTMLRNVSRVFRTLPTQAWASELLKKENSSLRTLPANVPSLHEFIQNQVSQEHASREPPDDNAQKIYIETYGCQMNGSDTGA